MGVGRGLNLVRGTGGLHGAAKTQSSEAENERRRRPSEKVVRQVEPKQKREGGNPKEQKGKEGAEKVKGAFQQPQK